MFSRVCLQIIKTFPIYYFRTDVLRVQGLESSAVFLNFSMIQNFTSNWVVAHVEVSQLLALLQVV
jgi:hypothetical protein